MSKCECLAGCLFFNDKMSNMPVMADQLKKKYCEGDNSGCARFKVFKAMGRDNVPKDLFPNQTKQAEALIAAK